MDSQTPASNQKRSWPITLLALIVLFVGVVHWMKFFLAIQQWDTLENAPLLISPLYLALAGLGWGLVSVPLVWGLWTGKLWAWYGIQIAGAFYYLATWVDLAWIAAPDLACTRWPFTLGVSILGLIYLFGTVHYPANRRFFERTLASK